MPAKAKPQSSGNTTTPPEPLTGSIIKTMNAPDLSPASIHRMKLPELQSAAAYVDGIGKSVACHFGIIRHALDNLPEIKSKKTNVTKVLRDAGLSPGTISDTSYAAAVYGLVVTKYLDFDLYQRMGIEAMKEFRLVLTNPHPKKKLARADAIKIVADGLAKGAKGTMIADEFRSLREHGLTVAEAEKVSKQAAADAKKAEEREKADAEKKKQEEIAKGIQKGVAEQLAAATKAGNTTPPATTPPTTTTGTPAANAASPGAPTGTPAAVVHGSGTPDPGKVVSIAKPYTASDFDADIQPAFEKIGKASAKEMTAALSVLEVYVNLLRESIKHATPKATAPTVVPKPTGKPAPAKGNGKKAA